MILSILIPSLLSRQCTFSLLKFKLYRQIVKGNYQNKVQILTFVDNGEATIGLKRNTLLKTAVGEYVCFIDDDDMVSDDYIKTLLSALESKPDCVSLRGVITWDGVNPEVFEHSIRYKAYATTTNAIKYKRYPNHLNCIKADIAKQFKFPEINHGEDTDWATQVFNSGLIKNEVYLDKLLYHYQYKPSK